MTDQQIARLFAEERRLELQLANVRARILNARRDYADRNHLLMLPSVDSMRRVLA